MKEVFAIIELISKILDFIPTSSQKVKSDLYDLKRRYREEMNKELHLRDDALIDNLKDRILELSEYAGQIIDINSRIDRDNGKL